VSGSEASDGRVEADHRHVAVDLVNLTGLTPQVLRLSGGTDHHAAADVQPCEGAGTPKARELAVTVVDRVGEAVQLAVELASTDRLGDHAALSAPVPGRTRLVHGGQYGRRRAPASAQVRLTAGVHAPVVNSWRSTSRRFSPLSAALCR